MSWPLSPSASTSFVYWVLKARRFRSSSFGLTISGWGVTKTPGDRRSLAQAKILWKSASGMNARFER